ncbi:MAG: hypothetical protein INR71_01110 [Terriglobus roseus]|nr:hypothetical protein [Terriglobus roseus]
MAGEGCLALLHHNHHYHHHFTQHSLCRGLASQHAHTPDAVPNDACELGLLTPHAFPVATQYLAVNVVEDDHDQATANTASSFELTHSTAEQSS